MATDQTRYLPAARQLPAIQQPRRLPVQRENAWINDQMDEKAIQATQEAALGAYAAQVNTAMVAHNAAVTIRGFTAIEGMRTWEGSPKFQKRVGKIVEAFQEDLAYTNRLITRVASENVTETINRPFERPAPVREPGFWDFLLGDGEE